MEGKVLNMENVKNKKQELTHQQIEVKAMKSMVTEKSNEY